MPSLPNDETLIQLRLDRDRAERERDEAKQQLEVAEQRLTAAEKAAYAARIAYLAWAHTLGFCGNCEQPLEQCSCPEATKPRFATLIPQPDADVSRWTKGE